ncbi:Fic family protein [Alteromonas sp. a30]|uniref:Fic family protein n=1 Tax=Alteromonas sp. a30 TaxID=2730917 RepID=UPI00227DE062|nr:Fic family protein [Alteromonas sp. a30]MCY7296454.1 Fic family protein [Alteromonas sp. a30]
MEKFSLSFLAARFMCGGSALTTGRNVSRKRLTLVNVIPDYPDIEAKLLSKEIEAYQKAKDLLRAVDKLTPEVLLDAHRCFFSNKFKLGRFRTTQNWIGKSLDTAEYVPPEPEKVKPEIENWLGYLSHSADSIELIIEAYTRLILLHPFPDANGRLSRAFLDVMYSRIKNDVVPLSLYRLGTNEKLYIKGVRAFGLDNSLGIKHPYWVDTISWSENTTINALEQIQKTKRAFQSQMGIFSISKEEVQLMDYLWLYPITTHSHLQQTFNWDKEFCHSALQKLCNLRLLTTKKLKNSKHQVVFVCENVFTCFEAIDDLFLNKRSK